MAMVRKGTVTAVEAYRAIVTDGEKVTPWISLGLGLALLQEDGLRKIAIGDTVAYVLFDDNTGLVLGRM